MRISNLLTDEAALSELGRRVAESRLARGMTQAQLAHAAGVSKRTVERLEAGDSTQLTNLIRCLRTLERLEALEFVLPERPQSPIDLLERRGKRRQRARPDATPAPAPTWTWGTEA